MWFCQKFQDKKEVNVYRERLNQDFIVTQCLSDNLYA